MQRNGDVAFVYLVQNNKAVMRTVNPGISEAGNTVVTGLNPGDVVADSSFEKLQNGSQVFESKVKLPSSTGEGAGTVAP